MGGLGPGALIGRLTQQHVQLMLGNSNKHACVHAACSFSEGVREDQRCGIIHSGRKDPAAVRSCTVSSATIQNR